MMKRQHSYTRKILCNQRCDSCHKAILFLGLRCKSCRKKYHRKCSECMSTECEKIPFFSSVIKDMTTTIQTTGRDIILSTQPEDLRKQQDRFSNSCHFSELNQSHTVDESLLCRDKTSTFGLEMHCDSHSDPNICTPGVKNANFFGSTADESDLQSVQYHSQASYTNDEDSLLPSSASSIYSSSFYSDSFNSLSGLVTSPNTLPMHSSQFLMPPSPAPSERRHSITSTWPQSAGHHFPMDNTQFSYQGTPVSSPPYNGHNNYERLHLVSGDAFDDQFEELKVTRKFHSLKIK
ncbi:hypothetical protein TrispH2_002490 [Trichoplax sp. H2]|nr:hypothetical protein TrispH2_002490 [Trichoplax sp. H2]|eukprot:RDD45218.1 hypothetical protein TrispH2_002490 [Trichoplax sp. H2]